MITLAALLVTLANPDAGCGALAAALEGRWDNAAQVDTRSRPYAGRDLFDAELKDT